MKDSSNVFIAGAWRNGLNTKTAALIATVEQRREAGFRMLPFESTVIELVDLLDSADHLLAEYADTVDTLTIIGEATAAGVRVIFEPELVSE